MQAMNNISDHDEKDRLSWRNSVLVWVSGAVLGWVIAVVAVYSVIRTEEANHMAQPPAAQSDTGFASDMDGEEMNNLMPAVGEDIGGREP
jgi:hypothetical protein